MSIQNPLLTGYLLTGSRNRLLYVEGSTTCLHNCPQFLSPLYEADKCFNHVPIYYQDAIMYIHPNTRLTFNYATPMSCDTNLRK